MPTQGSIGPEAVVGSRYLLRHISWDGNAIVDEYAEGVCVEAVPVQDASTPLPNGLLGHIFVFDVGRDEPWMFSQAVR